MIKLGKIFAAMVLLTGFAMQSGAAQAQCSPTNPACAPSQPRTSSSGGGGGGVGVQVDVGSAAKAIGGIFKKKKKKPVDQPVVVPDAPVEQAKPQVIFVPSAPVIQKLPQTVRTKAPVVRAKAQAAAPKLIVRKIAAPAVAVAKPVLVPEAIAEQPLPEPVPVVEDTAPAEPVATAAVVAPVEKSPAPDNNLYWIIGAAAAALVAAGTAAKLLLTPKITMDCSVADGTSRMVSNPSLTKPEVSFDVAIPGFSASTPSNLAIIA